MSEEAETKNSKLKSDYPIRVVAFLDVLGFSNRVNDIGDSYEKFQKVQQTVESIAEDIAKISSHSPKMFAAPHNVEPQKANTIAELVKALEDPKFRRHFRDITSPFEDFAVDGWITNPNMGIRSMFLSDSILLHSFADELNCYNLVSVVIGIARKLLLQGTLVRGAITLGPLYHSGSAIFGKGLVDAFYSEKEIAGSSRILIHPPTASNQLFYYDHTFEIGHSHDPLVKQDADGMYFVDIFIADHQSRNIMSGGKRALFFWEAREVLASMLRESSRVKEWSKIAWLGHRFNCTVTKYPDWGIESIEIPEPPRL